MNMLIALDPRGIDLAYPVEFKRRSAVTSGVRVETRDLTPASPLHISPSSLTHAHEGGTREKEA